jgi:poly-gamma-glutamate biosynthesis protein PgsC/CapC
MSELLPFAIGVGLVVGMLITEFFGIATGGLVVPGYIALYLLQPLNVLMTIVVAFLSFGMVKVLTTFLVVYGHRRTALMILIGYLVGMLIRRWTGLLPADFSVIGFIIPGLIAVWMDRQGVAETLFALLIVSSIVRLILILTVGAELIG